MPLAVLAKRGSGPKSRMRAFRSSRLPDYPKPDLIDHLSIRIVFLLTSPTLLLSPSAYCAGRISIALVPREHPPGHVCHLVGACSRATSMRGLRASKRLSRDPGRPPSRLSHCTTDIAMIISKCWMSRWPIFEVRPSFCLPPLECYRGARPSQAEKSRSLRHSRIWGANVVIAMAVTGPVPGSCLSRRATLLSFDAVAMQASSLEISAPVCAI